MARVVQCPACGQSHPLDTLAGTPTFSCTGCGRTLRTPTELVRPSGVTPAVRAVPDGAPASAPKSAAPARSKGGLAPTRERRARRVGSGTLGLPVRMAAWVAAVVLGLLLTWLVASAVGFISRPQVVDMFRSSSPTNYIRLFLLVPVWAFMSACLATGFIEGARLLIARRAGTAGPENAGANVRRPSSPTIATHVPDVEDHRADPEPARDPVPPGQRTRIRPREPTA